MLQLRLIYTQEPMPGIIKKNKTYLNSGLIILVSMILGKALSFAWKITFLRYNVSLLGKIEVLLTTLGLAITFSTLALPAALRRFALIRKNKSSSYFFLALKYSFWTFLMVCFSIITMFYNNIIFQSENTIFIFYFLLIVLISVVQESSLSYLNSQKKFILYGLGKYLLTPLFKIILLTGILLKLFPLKIIIDHVFISIGIAGIITTFFVFSKISWKKNKLIKSEKKQFLNYTTFISGSFISFIIYGSLDVYFLQYFFGNQTVGSFVGLLTIVNLTDLVLMPFLHPFQTHLSERKTPKKQLLFTKKTAHFIFKLGFLLSVPIALIGSKILPLISQKLLSISFLTMLGFALVKVFHSSFVLILRNHLDFFNNQKYAAKTMFLSLILKIIIGYFLVQKMGIVGLLLTNGLVDLIHILMLLKKVPIYPRLTKNLESLISFFPKYDS